MRSVNGLLGEGAVVRGLAAGAALPERVDSGDDHRGLRVVGVVLLPACGYL